jgi:hypothetical protein
MNIEEQIAEITTDLVELEACHPFLERLFSLQAGVWETALLLCKDLLHIQKQIKHLENKISDRLMISWLDYPISTHGAGYCLIIFFVESLHWSQIALFNKQWFLQRDVHRASIAR